MDDIEALMNLRLYIYKCHEKLKVLDWMGSLDSKEAQEIIADIKSTIEQENIIYASFENNRELLKQMLDKLVFPDREGNYLDYELTQIIDDDKEKLAKLAIYRKVVDLISKNNIQKAMEIPESSQRKKIVNDYVKFIELEDNIIKDFINIVLNIYHSYARNANASSLLLNIKYNCALVFDFVLEDLIQNDYEISPDVYLTTDAITSILQLSDIDEARIKEKQFDTLYVKYLMHYITAYSKDNLRKEYYFLASEILLRSMLVVLGDKKVEILQNDQCIYAMNKKEQLLVDESKIFTQVASKLFDYYKLDREVPKRVSLKLKK